MICNKKNIHLIFLIFTIFASCLIMFNEYIFGNRLFIFMDIGGDTKEQYIMYYYNIVNKLIESDFSFWNFNNGIGASIFAGGIHLFDPFNWILYLLGVLLGPSKLPYLIIYMFILKIILSGLACYAFLSCFKCTEKNKLLASYIYSFNGYMMIWGQHYQFQTIIILFPILLFCSEKAIENKINGVWLSLISAIISIYSFYFAYMSFFVVGIYTIIRTIYLEDTETKKKIIIYIGKISYVYLFIFLGLMLSSFVFLPSAYLTLNVSGRLEIEIPLFDRLFRTFFSIYETGYYKSLILRFFSANLEGINSDYIGYRNYYENINVYFSVLFVIIFPQFILQIFKKEISKKKKLMIGIGVGIGVASLLMPIISLILNGFTKPFSRHSYIYMPFFALIIALTLDNIINLQMLSRRVMFVSIGLFLSAMLIGILNMSDIKNYYIYNIVMLTICYLGICYYLNEIKLGYNKYKYLILIIIVGISIIGEGYIVSSYRATLSKKDEVYFDDLYGQDITQALEYIKNSDKSFYRIEKDFVSGSYYMDSMAQDYNSISTYNSLLNVNIKKFIKNVYPSLGGVYEIQTTFRNVVDDNFLASILNVKYLISKDKNLEIQGYKFLEEFGDISVYKNENIISSGIFYEKSVLENEFDYLDVEIERNKILSDAVILDKKTPYNVKIDSLLGLKQEKIEDLLDYSNIYYNEATNLYQNNLPKSLELGKNNIDPNITLNINTDKYEVLESGVEMRLQVYVSHDDKFQIFNISDDYIPTEKKSKVFEVYKGKVNIINYTIPKYTKQLRLDYEADNIKIKNIEFYDKKINRIPDKSLFIVEEFVHHDKISGNINAKDDGILYLSIPFESGWKAYVNDVEIPIIKANYGFMGLEITKGYHNIDLVYNAPLFKIGKYITFVSFLIFSWACIRSYKLKHLNKERL